MSIGFYIFLRIFKGFIFKKNKAALVLKSGLAKVYKTYASAGASSVAGAAAAAAALLALASFFAMFFN